MDPECNSPADWAGADWDIVLWMEGYCQTTQLSYWNGKIQRSLRYEFLFFMTHFSSISVLCQFGCTYRRPVNTQLLGIIDKEGSKYPREGLRVQLIQ